MGKRITEKFFSLFVTIIYKQIGTKIRTDAFKFFFNSFFIVVEKAGLKFKIISSNYIKLYDDIVEKEINMAKISSTDKILVMGCGSLPATSALLAIKTKANVTAIDINQKSLQDASLYLKNLQLNDKIILEHADGQKYPVDTFNFIFILHGVRPQKQILHYVAENIQKKTKIIFRTFLDEKDKTSNTSQNITDFFLIENNVRSEYLGSIDSLLLSKKC